jgi:hypothetical protein
LKNDCDVAIPLNSHGVLLKILEKTILTETGNGGIATGLCTGNGGIATGLCTKCYCFLDVLSEAFVAKMNIALPTEGIILSIKNLLVASADLIRNCSPKYMKAE